MQDVSFNSFFSLKTGPCASSERSELSLFVTSHSVVRNGSYERRHIQLEEWFFFFYVIILLWQFYSVLLSKKALVVSVLSLHQGYCGEV